MTRVVACQDCRFYSGDWGSSCHHPTLSKAHVIYGSVPSYPESNRTSDALCGRDAKHFQRRRSLWNLIFGGDDHP